METLRLVLLFVHVLGFAALLGGLLVLSCVVLLQSTPRAQRDGSGAPTTVLTRPADAP